MKKLFLFIAAFVLLASGCATYQGQSITDGPTTPLKSPSVDLPQPPMRFDINDLVRRLEVLERSQKRLSLDDIKKLAAKTGASNFYGAIALTGGTSGSLDNIDGTALATGDAAYTITSTAFYVHYLNASSGASESSPDVISPDDNAGSKRWILIFQGDPVTAEIAQLSPTDGNFIVGNGSTWVTESGDTARISLGVGSTDSPTFVTAKLSGLTDTYFPYHVADATGLADSPLKTDGTDLTTEGDIFANDAAGPAFMNEAATTTNPTLVPNKAEDDTGIGWASDTLHFVLGGANEYSFSTTEAIFKAILTVSPDGTNEVFQVNDGTIDFSDGNAGTAGTATIDSSGNISYNKNFSATDLDGILGSNTPAAISGTTIAGTGVMTVSPDGTNEVFQVNDGSVDFSDGNAGTAGTMTIDSDGDISFNKDFAATVITGTTINGTGGTFTNTVYFDALWCEQVIGTTIQINATTELVSNSVLTVSPDGTNEVFQVNDGSVDFTDGNAGTTGTLTVAATGNLSYNKAITSPNIAEYGTIYIDAGAMVPCTTNPAEAGTNEYGTNDIDMDYMAFDPGATEERIQFKLVMPENWDRSDATMKAKFYWSDDTTGSAAETVEWGIKAGAYANDVAIDTALGTAVTISDTVIASSDMHITSATAVIVVAQAQALGDMIVFEVFRNTDGTDDMDDDAWLFGVLLQYKKANTVSAW